MDSRVTGRAGSDADLGISVRISQAFMSELTPRGRYREFDTKPPERMSSGRQEFPICFS